MKMVIFKTSDGWAVTPRANYYSYVQDARKVQRFPSRQWGSEQQVIDYLCKYTRATVNDFEHPAY